MRAYYSDTVSVFLRTPDETILGHLAERHHFDDAQEQKRAWAKQISILKDNLAEFPEATIFFEFEIPRMGRRIDNVLIHRGIIFLLEFKVKCSNYTAQAVDQVVDYALDLHHFHEGSHDKTIVPILVATDAPDEHELIELKPNEISPCLKANSRNLANSIRNVSIRSEAFDIKSWEDSPYKPTPTIIEAALKMYREHHVDEISRHGAQEINLTCTCETVHKIIQESNAQSRKSICFITGVPGAGKTLAGLNIAALSMDGATDERACFLSGNGPLVKVLRAALIKDRQNREEGNAKNDVDAFIQNIHHFRDEYVGREDPPIEKVVIFDEAQRAWDREQAENFMTKKRARTEFAFSEPEFLIDVMNRHHDWCVVVCLVGKGQEINTGEAGLNEWFRAIHEKFPSWHVYCAPQVLQNDSGADVIDKSKLAGMHVCYKNELHLNVSIRSFKAAKLSEYIQAVMDNEPEKACSIYANSLEQNYPIYLTRSIKVAKEWVKARARGTERIGLLAHSNALRLKPEGIFVKSNLDCEKWFLAPKNDVRSSYALEDCATEFDVQGLELDWSIVAWDANLQSVNGEWEYKKFRGPKWNNVEKSEERQYILNSYRVLLTRARQGMIIFVPLGSEEDNTRPPQTYDSIYSYLMRCGMKEIGVTQKEHG